MCKPSRTPARMSALHRSSQAAWCKEHSALSILGILEAELPGQSLGEEKAARIELR